MPPSRAIVVADAHLGASGPEVERAFHTFLSRVPHAGDDLIINGDLFDFWFEYTRVIPRRHFGTLVALRAARERGVHITFIGGNHDRWGGPFLSEDLGLSYHGSGCTEMTLAGRKAFVHHGDRLVEQFWTSKMLHRITSFPPTIAIFRAIHPDLGFRITDRLSNRLADSRHGEAITSRTAVAQEQWARQFLDTRPDIDLVVLGHTHMSALMDVGGRHYLNPGAFLDQGRYAVIDDAGLRLELFGIQAGAGS